MSTVPLTDSQSKMLDAIRKFWAAHRYSPTFRDLMRDLRMASPNGVKSVLRTLVRKGLITIQPYTSRSIVIVDNTDLLHSSPTTKDDHATHTDHPQSRHPARPGTSPEPRRR